MMMRFIGLQRARRAVIAWSQIAVRSQPILVGTVTIEKSEALSQALTKIKHQVLNAVFMKKKQKSSPLLVPGAVTIATNGWPRTDIQLGGNLDMRTSHEATDAKGQVDAVKLSAIASEIDALKVTALAEGGLYVVN